MKYQYTISRDSIGDYRQTTIYDEVESLDPDGFIADERIGDGILDAHGWTAKKEEVQS